MTNPAAGMPCPVCRVALVMSERHGVETPLNRGLTELIKGMEETWR